MLAAHMDYYGTQWGFGARFEAKLAQEMGAFLDYFDERQDLLLVARQTGAFAGSVAVSGRTHLRWFIVTAPGHGLGGRMLTEALAFSDRVRGDAPTYLTTFKGLDAAEALYLKHGFRLVSESEIDQWSGSVTERRFERR
jgi:GNAT superfamily N-acetyltransferase